MVHIILSNLYGWFIPVVAAFLSADILFSLSRMAHMRSFQVVSDGGETLARVASVSPEQVRIPIVLNSAILVLFSLHYIQAGTGAYYGPSGLWTVVYYTAAGIASYCLMYSFNSLFSYSDFGRRRTETAELLFVFIFMGLIVSLLALGFQMDRIGVLIEACVGFSLQMLLFRRWPHSVFRLWFANLPSIFITVTFLIYISTIVILSF